MSNFVKLFIFTILISLSTRSFSAEKVRIVFSELINNTANFYIEELVNVYKSIGVEPIVSILPEQRAVYLFEMGQFDAIGANIEAYEKINSNALKLEPAVLKTMPFKIYYRKKDFKRISKIEKPFILSSLNCIGCDEFSKVYHYPINAYVPELRRGLQMLQKGRADLIITSSLFMSKIPGGKKFKAFGREVYLSKLHHFISKDKAHLKERLESAIASAKNKGSFNPHKINYKK